MCFIKAQATPEFMEPEPFLFIFLGKEDSSTGLRSGFLGGSSGYLGRGGPPTSAHRVFSEVLAQRGP